VEVKPCLGLWIQLRRLVARILFLGDDAGGLFLGGVASILAALSIDLLTGAAFSENGGRVAVIMQLPFDSGKWTLYRSIFLNPRSSCTRVVIFWPSRRRMSSMSKFLGALNTTYLVPFTDVGEVAIAQIERHPLNAFIFWASPWGV
jgi:hypothetical protein